MAYSDKFKPILRRHKAALTRAKNSGDPEKILAAAQAALDEFEVEGWPDQWSLWQRAKDDAVYTIILRRA